MFPEAEYQYRARARQAQHILGTRLFPVLAPLAVTWARVEKATAFAARPALADFAPISEGIVWGAGWNHAWFHFTGELPTEWTGREAVVWLDLGTEALVFDAHGRVTQGLSPGGLLDNNMWKGTRPVVELTPLLAPGSRHVEFWALAGVVTYPEPQRFEDPVPTPLPTGGNPEGRLRHAKLCVFDRAVWDLYMDFEVLLDLNECLPEKSVRRAKLLRHLTLASEILGRTPDDLAAARAALAPAFDARANASDLRVHAVGHGHLDSAWLWPIATGREKCARTVANQLLLMDQYPEHVFGFSAALHYQWLAEDHPDLLARVKQRVTEGRWEVQGAMWVEADGNMPSGESLVRQFLHGARFFKEHFGAVGDFLWLPDVFGYPASLPQIMRHCGANTLVTQKISWSQFTKFPHNAFRWHGIDGTEVLACFPPENSYIGTMLPTDLRAAQDRNAERDRLDTMISVFGYGDGGGGPHAKHLERARRMADLEGCPPVELSTAGRFLDTVRARRDILDTWHGSFYLELHRGTLTTHAFVKTANRRMEEQLQALEILWSSAPAADWPAVDFDALWKMVLKNQFHDIIPGTSIPEVYAVTYAEYRAGFAATAALAVRYAARVLAPAPGSVTFFNSLPHAWSDAVRLPSLPPGSTMHDAAGRAVPVQGDFATVSVPPLGFATFRVEPGLAPTTTTAAPADGQLVLENELVRYEFDADARLVRGFDKLARRELVPVGEPGNMFSLYHDRPIHWDAWDIDITYERDLVATARAVAPLVFETGPMRATIRARLQVGASEIRQTIALRPGSRRLDFETEIEWREEHKMLRVAFPVTVRAATATYEIPYGHVAQPTHRNTVRELAMFEHSAHRYGDLSESGYGVALLNDGKYGHKIHGHTLDLGLLRAPGFPDPKADRGHHAFRYALFPHASPLDSGEVLAEAACFNRAPIAFTDYALPTAAAAPVLPVLPVLPVKLLDAEVSLEALKRSEDGTCWIVRLVERRGRHARVRLDFPQPTTLVETDGLEFAEGAATSVSGEHEFSFTPFQIRTWKLRR